LHDDDGKSLFMQDWPVASEESEKVFEPISSKVEKRRKQANRLQGYI
jgi:hypothetical protein